LNLVDGPHAPASDVLDQAGEQTGVAIKAFDQCRNVSLPQGHERLQPSLPADQIIARARRTFRILARTVTVIGRFEPDLLDIADDQVEFLPITHPRVHHPNGLKRNHVGFL
jgi:hypothetical protein